MFQGDHPDLRRTMAAALTTARDLGHTRAGSEHLLLALTTDGAVGPVLARHHVTGDVVFEGVRRAAPHGAGACADRETLAPLGIDVDALVARLGPGALDRVTGREPWLPWGARMARRRSAGPGLAQGIGTPATGARPAPELGPAATGAGPALGIDAQAVYAASLRLALARRERAHRVEHLALCLVALDPGVAWVLRAVHVEVEALLADLAASFPPPERNVVLRAERRLGCGARQRDLVRRYQRTTGRAVTSAAALRTLIVA